MMRETPLRHIKLLSCKPPYNFYNIFIIVIMNDWKKLFLWLNYIIINVENNAVNIYMKSLSTNLKEKYNKIREKMREKKVQNK